jgi:hypothetical protein
MGEASGHIQPVRCGICRRNRRLFPDQVTLVCVACDTVPGAWPPRLPESIDVWPEEQL